MAPIKGGGPMSARFDDACASVIRFMEEAGYSKNYKSEVRCALRSLGRFLDAAGAEFSDALASEWLEAELAPRGHIKRGVGRIAVKRVRDALANGRVTSGRLRDEKPAYDRLPSWAREVVDGFVGSTGDPVDARAYCSRFLLVAVGHGADGPGSIGPEHVAEWIHALANEHPCVTTNLQRLSYVRRMLSSLGGLVGGETVCLVDATVLSRRSMLEPPAPGTLAEAPTTATAHEVLSAATALHATAMPEAGYKETSLSTVRAVGNVLFTFLEVNGLGFSVEGALSWVDANSGELGCLVRSWRRAVLLIDAYIRSGRVPVGEVLSRRDPMEGVPDWARPHVSSYLDLRRREGLSESSLDNDLWSCRLLARHADSLGLSSFGDLTPKAVSDFGPCGCEGMSPRSVSQVVSLSRGFIAWLADEGVVDRRLTLSAKSPCAPSVRVVSVLDESQVSRIAEFRASASTPMELRDAAMVSLGLWEGLRACDVVALRLDAIDWRASKIAVTQRKTGAPVELPLMPEAGNSVAAWLLRGRPDDADSPCVFVRLVPPRVGLMTTTACEAALRHVLGDAYGDCEGFHELRRTYATSILRGGSGVRTVTEALGHRTDDSARPYLSLDAERMALCAMPLGEAARYPRRGGASNGKA